ncbi:MAG: hypothetical protein JWM89_515 [Acidimicrobiales bacterium]|nr:hypothetical protein [Acidimicrobiales bacterium]
MRRRSPVARTIVALALLAGLVTGAVACASSSGTDSSGTNAATARTSPTTTGPTAPATTATTATTRPPVPPKVVLIGDSMAREARTDIAADGRDAGLDLRLDVRGQAAPCSQERTAIAALAERPAVVAIEWIGNALFTAGCSKAFQPDEVVAEYRASLERIAAARLSGTRLALIGVPPIRQVPWDSTWAPLDRLYRDVAASEAGVEYLDVDPTIAPGGRFAATLPCTDAERAAHRCATYGAPAGQAIIRDPEGFHFCPVRYELSTGNCPVPSPGAARYARAIVDGLTALA